MVLQHFRQRTASERRPPGQHREQHAAQTVQVALRGDRPAVGLLRRHVLRGADQPAVGSNPRVAEQSGDAEIGQLEVVPFREQQIGRLQIAMDYAMVVLRA